MSKDQIETQLFQDVFLNVMALYSVLKAQPTPTIRRAELKQGEVTAESVDFLSDVEIKAKRVLSPTQYRLFLKFAAEEKPESVPQILRQSLGLMFLRSNLNFDGHYRVLYYRAKNDRLQNREEPMHFPEENE